MNNLNELKENMKKDSIFSFTTIQTIKDINKTLYEKTNETIFKLKIDKIIINLHETNMPVHFDNLDESKDYISTLEDDIVITPPEEITSVKTLGFTSVWLIGLMSILISIGIIIFGTYLLR